MNENSKRILKELKFNVKFFIESSLFIKTKKRGLVKLKLSETQEKIFGVIQELKKAGKAVRIIVLKARQIYCSMARISWRPE